MTWFVNIKKRRICGVWFTMNSTGILTSSTSVIAAPGLLGGYVLKAAAADVTVIFYDDPDSADGVQRWDDECTVAQARVGVVFPGPIRFITGIWAEVSGAGVEIKVLWRPL